MAVVAVVSRNIPVAGAILIIPPHVLLRDQVLDPLLDHLRLCLEQRDHLHDLRDQILMLHWGVLVRLHYLHDGAVDHRPALIRNRVHDLLLLGRLRHISFFRCTHWDEFNKDVGASVFKVYFDDFARRVKGRFIYLFFQQFSTRLTHHNQTRVKLIFWNLSFFTDFLVSPLFFFVEQVKDRGLEHVYNELVAFSLAERRRHFDSSKLAQPHNFSVGELIGVVPLKLRLNLFQNRWHKACYPFFYWPITVREHLNWSQLQSLNRIVLIASEINM